MTRMQKQDICIHFSIWTIHREQKIDSDIWNSAMHKLKEPGHIPIAKINILQSCTP